MTQLPRFGKLAPWTYVIGFLSIGLCIGILGIYFHGKVPDDLSRLTESEAQSEEQEYPANKGYQSSENVLAEKFVEKLNHHRKTVGLEGVTLDVELCQHCLEHAKNRARNEHVSTVSTQTSAQPTTEVTEKNSSGMVLVSYVEPMQALDRWMARLLSRTALLSPGLQRIGVEFDHTEGGDWICVVDAFRGRVESAERRTVVYPAPDQVDVPSLGFDQIDMGQSKGKSPGFPISVTFPGTARLQNVQASLTDDKGNTVDIQVSSPQHPLHAKNQRTTVGVHPVRPLEPRRSYTACVSVTVNNAEWREQWTFTTR